MIKTEKDNLQNIVFLVVSDADNRHPLSFDLVAKFERRDFDLGAFAEQGTGYAIEVAMPFAFVERCALPWVASNSRGCVRQCANRRYYALTGIN